ncbi:hypothetical protein D3C71_1661280 [compost metagenome]
MVLVRVPLGDDGGVREFILRVDALGAMLDLDRREIQPLGVTDGSAGATPLIDAVVPVSTGTSPGIGKPGRGMVCRVSSQWLLQCALGALGDAPAQDVDALLAAA